MEGVKSGEKRGGGGENVCPTAGRPCWRTCCDVLPLLSVFLHDLNIFKSSVTSDHMTGGTEDGGGMTADKPKPTVHACG